jgi:hypothetical protein
MIFRRRRTRIEIEHTTVTVMAGGMNSIASRPVLVMPSGPLSTESVLSGTQPFLAPEQAEPALDGSELQVTVTPDTNKSQNATQETLP